MAGREIVVRGAEIVGAGRVEREHQDGVEEERSERKWTPQLQQHAHFVAPQLHSPETSPPAAAGLAKARVVGSPR